MKTKPQTQCVLAPALLSGLPNVSDPPGCTFHHHAAALHFNTGPKKTSKTSTLMGMNMKRQNVEGLEQN